VYAHVDADGKIFYIGKGVRRRAWSPDGRHSLWSRYVEKHLGGSFQVRILQDNLSPEEAEELEAAWMTQCSPGLVNWVNMGRDTDFQALERFHALRNANRALIQQGKAMEKSDLERAAAIYLHAIESIREYAYMSYEKGLVAQLLEEEAAEVGRYGEIEALDRLTISLTKLGRAEDAARHAESYFALYRGDLQRSASVRISKRIEKALARKRKEIPSTERAEQRLAPDRPKVAER
jgi:tetratricopeptide (TPR) repeat protein